MSPLIGAIAFALLFILMALNMPIHAAFALGGWLGYAWIAGFDRGTAFLGVVPYGIASNYVLMTVPMFTLMGMFAFHSGVGRELFDTAYKWLGRLPGGLAMATTAACAGFGACTGSSVASAATMGSMALPEMRKHGYNASLSTGTIAAGGSLAILIPPSSGFIVYAIFTDTSIGKLFIAGVVPGIMLALMFMALIFFRVRRNPSLGPQTDEKFTLKEKITSVKGVWAMLALFAIVIGGLFAGIFTPNEAGAVGAFGALIIGLAKRGLNWKKTVTAVTETARVTAMIMALIIGAMIFQGLIFQSGLPLFLRDMVAGLDVPRGIILLIILATYIPLGMIMDTLAMLILTLPIYFPIVTGPLGVDPILFGVIVVIFIEMAMITPPVGLIVFLLAGMNKDIPMPQIFRGTIPFAAIMGMAVLILVLVPEISLFLPSIMMGK